MRHIGKPNANTASSVSILRQFLRRSYFINSCRRLNHSQRTCATLFSEIRLFTVGRYPNPCSECQHCWMCGGVLATAAKVRSPPFSFICEKRGSLRPVTHLPTRGPDLMPSGAGAPLIALQALAQRCGKGVASVSGNLLLLLRPCRPGSRGSPRRSPGSYSWDLDVQSQWLPLDGTFRTVHTVTRARLLGAQNVAPA
jgi:hypothetical protein